VREDNTSLAATIEGLEKQLEIIELGMWVILRKLTSPTGNGYDSIHAQYKDLDKAQAMSVDARKLRQARTILQQLAMASIKGQMDGKEDANGSQP
jgi:hypothetical protein